MTDSILFDVIARLEARVTVLEQWRDQPPLQITAKSSCMKTGCKFNFGGYCSGSNQSRRDCGALLTEQANKKGGDEATVESLITAMSEEHTGCRSEARQMARAILAAIKAGKIPGVCTMPDVPVQMVGGVLRPVPWCANTEERDELRTKLEDMTKRNDSAVAGELANYEACCEAEKERDELREEVEKLKARRVKLPRRCQMATLDKWEAERSALINCMIDMCANAIRSAGIAIEGEE